MKIQKGIFQRPFPRVQVIKSRTTMRSHGLWEIVYFATPLAVGRVIYRGDDHARVLASATDAERVRYLLYKHINDRKRKWHHGQDAS